MSIRMSVVNMVLVDTLPFNNFPKDLLNHKNHVTLNFARSGGPGGQNVNKGEESDQQGQVLAVLQCLYRDLNFITAILLQSQRSNYVCCLLQSGLLLSLMSDWNPHADLQAMARAHISLFVLSSIIAYGRFGSVPVSAAIETMDESDGFAKDSDRQDKIFDGASGREWKQLNSKDLGISSSMIAKPSRKVLNGLKSEGHDVYFVGGCVRDLILKRTPKDFDILTSA